MPDISATELEKALFLELRHFAQGRHGNGLDTRLAKGRLVKLQQISTQVYEAESDQPDAELITRLVESAVRSAGPRQRVRGFDLQFINAALKLFAYIDVPRRHDLTEPTKSYDYALHTLADGGAAVAGLLTYNATTSASTDRRVDSQRLERQTAYTKL